MLQVFKLDDLLADERHVELHERTSATWANHIIWDQQEQKIATVFNDPSNMNLGFVQNPYELAVNEYIDRIVCANK